ncbi:hypothetical protein V6N13_043627 [Hibiscus sabdariffa]|uniref:Uncharacterized protein n=1 Tax=Hibiscus sabdariffa TaxID=183260 RepID=A0ABR2RFQ1_9ROSI
MPPLVASPPPLILYLSNPSFSSPCVFVSDVCLCLLRWVQDQTRMDEVEVKSTLLARFEKVWKEVLGIPPFPLSLGLRSWFCLL